MRNVRIFSPVGRSLTWRISLSTIQEYAEENYFDSKTANLVYREIISRADGMFMWAVLAWNKFTDGVGLWTDDLISKRIADLQSLPPGMEELYHHLLLSVDKVLRPELMHLLQWIIAARRPLSTTQISFALALQERPQISTDIKRRLSIRAFIKRTCSHLLQIDDMEVVTIIHQSFKEFLLGVRNVKGTLNIFWMDVKSINLQRAKDCIVYMSLSDISDERDGPWVMENSRWSGQESSAHIANFLAQYPFLDYAVESWAFHLEGLDDDFEFYQLFKRVISQERNFRVLNNLHLSREFYTKRPPIWVAFDNGLYSLLGHLVKDGHDINESFNGENMVHMFGMKQFLRYSISHSEEAMRARNWDLLKRLLSMGLDINGRDLCGGTLLLNLVMEASDGRAAKYCSYMNIEANSPSEALTGGIRMLLKVPHVDINAKDQWGTTALHAAARHIAPIAKTVIETLTSHPDLNVNPEDDLGRTPLNLAIHWGKKETAELLLNTPGVKIDTSFTIQGESPLINAARQGWPDLVLSMLRHLKSDEIPEHLDLHGGNTLHWTITGGMLDASFLALRKSPTIVAAADSRGITPLHIAAKFGQDRILKALLVHGASPTHQTGFGETPLHMAAAEGHLRTLKTLMKWLSRPSDINKKDVMGWTVTHRSVSSGNETLQKFLVSLPHVDLKKADRHGRTPIAFAASLASLNTLQLFLQARPEDIDFLDEFGNTLLHLAAKGNNESTIPFLLGAIGQKGNEINDWGQTALDLLPLESWWRRRFISFGLVHSVDFFDKEPHCCFSEIRPEIYRLKYHHDWEIICKGPDSDSDDKPEDKREGEDL
ncbi:hypothetical protein N7528_006852 [Penicillium herquei]|nr:hypothetical protein N7528_006852 [Penicillium herquei]